jgi:hypothetical protein
MGNITEYSDRQINDIVLAACTNNQIYWIIQDVDIRRFFNDLIKLRRDIINKINLAILDNLLNP